MTLHGHSEFDTALVDRLHCFITTVARNVRTYENYLSSAAMAFGTIFNREDTPFPLSSCRNTYLTAMAILSMGHTGDGGEEQINSDDRTINTSTPHYGSPSWKPSSFFSYHFLRDTPVPRVLTGPFDFSAARVLSTRLEEQSQRNSPAPAIGSRVTSDRTVCVAINRDCLFVRLGRGEFLVALTLHGSTVDVAEGLEG